MFSRINSINPRFYLNQPKPPEKQIDPFTVVAFDFGLSEYQTFLCWHFNGTTARIYCNISELARESWTLDSAIDFLMGECNLASQSNSQLIFSADPQNFQANTYFAFNIEGIADPFPYYGQHIDLQGDYLETIWKYFLNPDNKFFLNPKTLEVKPKVKSIKQDLAKFDGTSDTLNSQLRALFACYGLIHNLFEQEVF